MMISGVNGGASPYVPKPAATGGDSVAQLEQQKKAIESEIKNVRKNNKLAPDEKTKQLDSLEKKLQKIEASIEKASSNANRNSNNPVSDAKEATAKEATAADLISDNSNSTVKGSDLNADLKSEQLNENKFDENGELIDVYA